MSIPAQRAIEKCISTYAKQAEFDIDDYFGLIHDARTTVARLINADPEEIVFTHNTSEGIYIALVNLPLRPGDTVLIMDEVFPAVRYIVDYNLPYVDKQYAAFTDQNPVDVVRHHMHERLKAVVVDYVQFLSGETLDLATLSHYTKEQGIYLVVDGIQGIGVLPFDVRQQDVDFLACGAAKWLFGPSGAGFLYVNKRTFRHIQTMHTGWLGAEWRGFENCSVNPPLYKDARKYELGTRNVMGIQALSENINILLQFGKREVYERITSLKARLRGGLESSSFGIITPEQGIQSGILTARHRGDTEHVFRELRKSKVVFSLRNGCLRFSPHFYNTEEEVDRVIDIIAHSFG
jgi:selenocysteine lyase/cysteine desulfurase